MSERVGRVDGVRGTRQLCGSGSGAHGERCGGPDGEVEASIGLGGPSREDQEAEERRR